MNCSITVKVVRHQSLSKHRALMNHRSVFIISKKSFCIFVEKSYAVLSQSVQYLSFL